MAPGAEAARKVGVAARVAARGAARRVATAPSTLVGSRGARFLRRAGEATGLATGQAKATGRTKAT